jgi:hypothetical protein
MKGTVRGERALSEPWEKGQKPLELPNPELNPLQNPTLGKNLGRWAQVYFTSPPEKREQAVVDLLRELESETDPRAPRLEQVAHTSPIDPRLICKVCQQPNELDQRYCGLCGSSLRAEETPEAKPARILETVPVKAAAQNWKEELPSFSPAAANTDERDLQWLREKSLSRLSDYEESSGKWKYILAAVLVVAAAFGTLQWVSNRPTVTNPQPAASTPSTQASQPAQPVPSAPPAATAAQSSPAPQTEAPAKTKLPEMKTSAATDRDVRSARVVGDSPRASTAPPVATPHASSQTMGSTDGGTQELNLAQGYLEGKHGSRDPAEAAKWLWKAVAKQNSTADVLLGDLYLSGDGVTKSCAQAELLLSAAARKGEPSAAEKLQQLKSSGCR